METARVALVTGGASGMGLAVVDSLVQSGWKVAVVDMNQTTGEKVVQRHGDKVLFFVVDVTKYDQQADAFKKTWAAWGRIDLVYANAGIGDRTDLILPVAEEDGAPPRPDLLVVDVNLYGAIYSSYLALHFFRKNTSNGGNLVMTSSLAGIYAAPGNSGYGAAKHGVIGLMRTLAHRLKKRGEPIQVNAVCPAFVPTDIFPAAVVELVPQQYVTPTAAIVRAVQMFIDDATLTGQAMEISGDKVIHHPLADPTEEASIFVMSGGLGAVIAQGLKAGK